MHLSFLPYLVNPNTQEPLEIKIFKQNDGCVIEGELFSPNEVFPIVNGIPRFVKYKNKENYTNSFGYQWNKWSKVQFDSENVGRSMENYTSNMWEKITHVSEKNLKNKVIGDFGCGAGRFIETLRHRNAKIIGIDLSEAVEAARENFVDDQDVLICQADVLNPPIKAGILDGAYSIGVLHHTLDPEKGVNAIIKCIKEKGWIAICVYSKGDYYEKINVNLYRKFFNLLWPLLGHYPPLFYSYFTSYILIPIRNIPLLGKYIAKVSRLFFPHIVLPDVRWSLLDTFDSITPSYQSAHETYEVFKWLKHAGLTNIEPSEWGRTVFHGEK